MERRGWRSTAAYAALLAASFVVGVAVTVIGNFGDELDNNAYDFMLRRYQPKPWRTESAILAIDEHTLQATPGGMQGIRTPLAEALRLVSAVHGPKPARHRPDAGRPEQGSQDRRESGGRYAGHAETWCWRVRFVERCLGRSVA